LSMKVLKRAERGWRWVSVKDGREGSVLLLLPLLVSGGGGVGWEGSEGSGDGVSEEGDVEGSEEAEEGAGSGSGSGCFGCTGWSGSGGDNINGGSLGPFDSGSGLPVFSSVLGWGGGGGCRGGGGAVENRRGRPAPARRPTATLQRRHIDGRCGRGFGNAAAVNCSNAARRAGRTASRKAAWADMGLAARARRAGDLDGRSRRVNVEARKMGSIGDPGPRFCQRAFLTALNRQNPNPVTLEPLNSGVTTRQHSIDISGNPRPLCPECTGERKLPTSVAKIDVHMPRLVHVRRSHTSFPEQACELVRQQRGAGNQKVR
jgi:hypothetical protein